MFEMFKISPEVKFHWFYYLLSCGEEHKYHDNIYIIISHYFFKDSFSLASFWLLVG